MRPSRAIVAILAVVIIALILLNFDSCKKAQDLKSDYDAIKGYSDSVMHYKDKNGNLVEYNKSLEVSEESLIASIDGLEGEIKRLRIKSLRNVTNVSTEARIDTIRIGFSEPLPCDDFNAPFSDTTKYYTINGFVTKKAVTLNNITIPDSQQIVVATKKNGLFKKNDLIVTITHSNPYIKTTGLTNYNIRKEQKKFSIGPALTYGLTIPDFKPSLVVGISIQYKLIRF